MSVNDTSRRAGTRPIWIDAHAHLYEFSPSGLRALIDEACAAGVSTIVNSATSLDSSRTVIEQSRAHGMLVPTVGISPFDTASLPEEWDTELLSCARCPEVAALGEIGLDATNPSYPPASLQVPIFERQLECARACGLPVIVHSRGSGTKAAEMCAAAAVSGALFHCFTGTPGDLETVIDNGFYVSFSGIITFKNSALDSTVAAAPLNRILIETDTPYLAPVPFRGRPNRPAWVSLVGEKVARIKGCDPGALADAVAHNFTRFFGRHPAKTSLCAER